MQKFNNKTYGAVSCACVLDYAYNCIRCGAVSSYPNVDFESKRKLIPVSLWCVCERVERESLCARTDDIL